MDAQWPARPTFPNPIPSQTFVLGYTGAIRLIMIDIQSSYGSPAAALAEVRFSVDIPEPGVTALLALTATAVGLRRRRP